MASVVTYSSGLRRIDFALTPNGERKTLRLGRVSAKAAAGVKAKVEAIIADKQLRRAHDAETAEWLGGLDESMLSRMRAVGLADGVGLAHTTLGAFLARYFDTLTVKPSTRTFYSHTRRNLESHFSETRILRDITEADADGWRTWLVETEGLSPATVARRVIAARTIWRKAVRWKLATRNPFDGVKGGHQCNESRKHFVASEIIEAVIAGTPDLEWRAIIALARYGGLRTPSETFALRWGDIDWARGTMRVPCPKLAHNERLASRIIPLFPEVRKPLLALFGEAEPGPEHVIVRHRTDAANLRTQFERLIARAGVKIWPRLFHNLRASRESELMREFDLATVCRWIGNSPAVAARHYATSIDLDADFRRAAGLEAPRPSGQAQQNAQQSASADDGRGMSGETENVQNHRENGCEDVSGQSLANAVNSGAWALQDSNL